MTAAAFQATYSDWRIIKGRKVVQVVLELPIEKADEAYQVLGGMPIAANEIWCAVARLDPASQREDKPAETKPRPVQSPGSAGAEKERRKFDTMSGAQQAGMLCADAAFRTFLRDKYDHTIETADHAAEFVRATCLVQSRREIEANNIYWNGLISKYRLWQREAEVVPA